MATNWSFSGTFTALVTPFTAGGEQIDFAALERLVLGQIDGGVSGLLPCGTTGETPTLSEAEQREIIQRVVKLADGRVPVVVGTGSNNTAKTVAASQWAVAAGADAVMVVMPYYNKPNQRGMREHVLAVAKAVAAPIILYNIPGRSVVDLAAETTEQICELAPTVVAVKDATGGVDRCQQLKQRLGDRLAVMSGDDPLTLAMMAVGASGVISVSSNVFPDKVSQVTELMSRGELAAARRAHFELLALHEALFVEPNPVPCKLALSLLGTMNADVRLPLVAASDKTRETVSAALSGLGIAIEG